MNALNSIFSSGAYVLLIVNAFFITGGNSDGGGLLNGVLGNDGLLPGLLGGNGGSGLLGGLLGGDGNQGGGLLGGLLGTGSSMASNGTESPGSITNWVGQQTTCSMSNIDVLVDAVVKNCNSTSMSCDECMKKVCGRECEMTCDQNQLQATVFITLCLNLLAKLDLLELVKGLVNVNLDAKVKAALQLMARIGLKL